MYDNNGSAAIANEQKGTWKGDETLAPQPMREGELPALFQRFKAEIGAINDEIAEIQQCVNSIYPLEPLNVKSETSAATGMQTDTFLGAMECEMQWLPSIRANLNAIRRTLGIITGK